MRLAVIGIGGVGGYFGGKLAYHYAQQKDIDVIFIAREKHLNRIQKNGLHLITEESVFNVFPTLAIDNPENTGIFDLVLFCVKGYDLESSAQLLKNNITNSSIVISLLNGVNNAERLSRIFPGVKVLNGCVYISSGIIKPGVVRQTGGPCQILFGAEDGKNNEFKKIENILRNADIKAELKSDIKTAVWKKYIFISPAASATTYLGKTFGEIMDDTASKKLLTELIEEVISITEATGVKFSNEIIHESLKKLSLFPYNTKSSMQLDFERGGKTELETFTGYIVNRGNELDIDTPLHKKVYRKLLKMLSI